MAKIRGGGGGGVVSCPIGIKCRALHRHHLESDSKATLRAHRGNFGRSMSFSVSAKADLQWWIDNDTATNVILVKEWRVTLTIYASCQSRRAVLSGLLLRWSVPSRGNVHFTPIIWMRCLHFSQMKYTRIWCRSFWTVDQLYRSFGTSMLFAMTHCLRFGSGVLCTQDDAFTIGLICTCIGWSKQFWRTASIIVPVHETWDWMLP